MMVRPREGHDLHLEGLKLRVVPAARLRWKRDVYDNSIALLDFQEGGSELILNAEIEVGLWEDDLMEYELARYAVRYPFQYDVREQVELIPYRLTSYPYDSDVVGDWLSDEGLAEMRIDTLELLERLNGAIFRTLKYMHREEMGVQLPCETLEKRSGSCRDYAVLMMEAVRHLGFAARFVSGYIQMGAGQHGATHAWIEVYLPGLGWRGYDPTNNKRAGSEHVTVAVARDQDAAAPVSGSWSGPPGAFESMEVVVRVE